MPQDFRLLTVAEVDSINSQIEENSQTLVDVLQRLTALEAGGGPAPDPDPTPDPDPVPDPDPTPDPDPPPTGINAHRYYEDRLAHSGLIGRLSFRDQEEIDQWTHVTLYDGEDNPVVEDIDASEILDGISDFAAVKILENKASLVGFIPRKNEFKSCQVRYEFPIQTSGQLWYCWDVRWYPEFKTSLIGTEMQTHKAFQLGRNTDDRGLEIRNRYSRSEIHSKVDVRTYIGTHSQSDVLQHAPNAGQLLEYENPVGEWVRHFARIDIDNSTFSYWIASERINASQLYLNAPINHTDFNEFWLELNSSQTRFGPEARICDIRNLIITSENLLSILTKPIP